MTVDRLETGDFLPDFKLINQRGRPAILRNRARGKALVLVFYPDNDSPAAQQFLGDLAEHYPALCDVAQVFLITGERPESNANFVSLHQLPFEILADHDHGAARAYGIEDTARDVMATEIFTAFVADANRRILQIERAVAGPGLAARLLGVIERQPHTAPREMTLTAPVLNIPKVLDEAFCRRLIEVYETGGNIESGVFRDRKGETIEVLDPDSKIRRDHDVVERELSAEIARHVGNRIAPEVFKAFNYRITNHETFKIACYDATTGGYFRPHRDNVTLGSAHRRFALTLNLNTGDYEGGYLCFPEYGPHLYRPDTGGAVVFSCSLLHEATPVTAGRRFVLLGFLYGADGRQIQQQRPGPKPGDRAQA